MRILHTVEFYHPRVGGAELVVQRVSESLRRRGHEVTVATSAQTGTPVDEEIQGVRVVRFDVRGNAVKGIRGNADAYRRFIREERADIMMNYAAQAWPTDIAMPMLLEIASGKVLAACGYSGLVGLRRPLYALYFHRLPRFLAQYDRVIYHSARYQDKAFGDRHGLRNGCVIPNGIDLSEFEGIATDFASKHAITTPYLLVTVSNHYRIKGHARVIRAFRALCRRDVTLAILGRAPSSRNACTDACRRAARRDPQIRVIENPPRRDVVAALRGANAFLLGSHIEAYPLVILEAMASGTPFVSFDVGSVAELPGGLVVRSVREMAAATARILGKPELAARLSEEGRAAAMTHDWEHIVDRYEELYLAVAASRHRSSIRTPGGSP
jgi:L-malate glycosyltransferase